MAGSVITRWQEIAREVDAFARSEAGISGLPGLDLGPGDAYRHLVGVAELSRRLGPLRTHAIAESNELRSFAAMLGSAATMQPIAGSNTIAARRMDRHNNRIALWIGATAASPEQVVARVRAMMERAIATTGGTGRNDLPVWQPSRHWPGGGSLADWLPSHWPDLDDSEHMRAYHAILAARGETPRQTGGGPVQVSPHMRDGHPVSGYTRAAPTR